MFNSENKKLCRLLLVLTTTEQLRHSNKGFERCRSVFPVTGQRERLTEVLLSFMVLFL